MWGQGNGVAQEGVATPDRTRSRNRASFLRMTSELDNANHALALAFGGSVCSSWCPVRSGSWRMLRRPGAGARRGATTIDLAPTAEAGGPDQRFREWIRC
jgi:hypothetical protein